MKIRFVASLALVVLPLVAALGCGDDDGASSSGGASGSGGPSVPPVCSPGPAPQKPPASCDVTIETPPETAVRHVPEGTAIQYCSNPPSSGEHYPIWAAYQEYDKPVEWPYLVHSMEHGAVVLLYKCDGPCPEIVDALRKVRDGLPADPLCASTATPRRIIIAPTPSPPIVTPVAAAAWGATYQAACVDAPTLDAFIRERYAKTVENFCDPGKTF